MRCSDFELEILQIFWEHGDLTAPEVHKMIEAKRSVAYNTIKTIIDRLEKKGGLIRVRHYGRTILFRANADRNTVTTPIVQSFLDKLFKGDRKELISHLFQESPLSDEDIKYLENLIQSQKKSGKGT